MFIELLESEEEKSALAMLCFAVAIAEPLDIENKGIEIFNKAHKYDFAYKAGAILSKAGLKNSKFLSIFGIKDIEAELLEKIIAETDGSIPHISRFVQKAETIIHKMPEYQDIFRETIAFSLAGLNFSFKSKKIILFEMSNMAFCDGTCATEEMAVLHITGEIFGFNAEVIDEIIDKSSQLNNIYNQAVEIIYE